MKSFFWKFVLCIVPVALAAWVSVDAVVKYANGDPGGFKLGVDLVGGTILVYEIDLRKSQETVPGQQQQQTFDPVKNINVLAEALKRRIDPNDLYNIVIRPAGGEGRVEIILPTGGIHRAEKAEAAWNALLKKMEERYGLSKLEVSRGRVLELADRIQILIAEKNWNDKLFKNKEAWERLLRKVYDAREYPDAWGELSVEDKKTGAIKPVNGLTDIPAGDLPQLQSFIISKLASLDAPTTEKAVEQWIKKKAWEELLVQVRKEWPNLNVFQSDLERIPVDNVEQLALFIQARGSAIGQSGLSILQRLISPSVLDNAEPPEELWKATDQDKKDAKSTDNENKKREEWRTKLEHGYIEKFIESNYGPSQASIQKTIGQEMKKTGQTHDLTVEEVQRIKDLVAKVGSLEFRILANSVDDKLGIKAAEETIKRVKENKPGELSDRAKKGLPPPPPMEGNNPDSKQKAVFTINLPRNQKSIVTYSWVELGPQERKALNLDNAARNDATRNGTWLEAQSKMDQTTILHDLNIGPARKPLLQGALFYVRKCEDRNLTDEERRTKAVEYFVLARDPEIDPKTGLPTPKIGGEYLVSAVSAPGSDLRPAVHFSFNTTGGNLFGEITRKNIPSDTGPEDTKVRRHLAIILDGLVSSAPTINSEIRTQGQISGNFTQKEVDNLVNILRAGQLPATLKPTPVSENTMAPTLGQDTINRGVVAILAAFAAVIVFMIIYYRFAGLVASMALLANLILTVGFMVSVQATFTLPGLAGIVLMLGMAVDANILIYERLREERERGATITLALRQGYERALPTILDTHLSSIFTAIVLYVVGNDQLKGFGVSLTVGLIISLFTSLYMTRVLFDFWQVKGWLTKLSMLRFFARPDIDFMGIRNVMFVATISLAVLGIGLFIGRLPNDLNIDFVGGTAYGAQLTKPVSVKELRDFVDEDNQKRWLEVKVEEEEGSEGLRYKLTYKNPNGALEKPYTVTLANAPLPNPPGADKEDYPQRLKSVVTQREAIMQKRAGQLPDASVEQIFVSFAAAEGNKKSGGDEGKSAHFTIRTSEKEPELVRAMLTRLLREKDGTPLMKSVYMKIDKISDREWKLSYFSDEKLTQPGYASPSFVKTLFNRELTRELKPYEKKDKAEREKADQVRYFEVSGEGKGTEEGRFPQMRLKFETKLDKEFVPLVERALEQARINFEASPAPDRLENFDSQLATETRFRAMWAIVASWGAILLYLWFRFGNWTFGMAAVVCLVHDLFITMGCIAAAHFVHGTWIGDLLMIDDFKIDLPAVAALLTLVGYSVNDTIVVFDRIREVRGKNPDLTPQMINDSVNQTLSRTVLASFTTWLVVVVLYIWGGPGVHLFAFVMVVGVIVGTYSSIYIASPLLLFLGEGHRSTAKTLEARTGIGAEGAPA